jgi:hypothetical protein
VAGQSPFHGGTGLGRARIDGGAPQPTWGMAMVGLTQQLRRASLWRLLACQLLPLLAVSSKNSSML